MPWTTQLVGRAAELGNLEGEPTKASAGEFRCALLLADPGIGKDATCFQAAESEPLADDPAVRARRAKRCGVPIGRVRRCATSKVRIVRQRQLHESRPR